MRQLAMVAAISALLCNFVVHAEGLRPTVHVVTDAERAQAMQACDTPRRIYKTSAANLQTPEGRMSRDLPAAVERYRVNLAQCEASVAAQLERVRTEGTWTEKEAAARATERKQQAEQEAHAKAEAEQSVAALSVAQKRQALSAILCIDIDVQEQNKTAIKQERDNARASGGGIVDMEAIHGWQDDFARAGREASFVRKQLAAFKQKPEPCNGAVARVYNCINNRADQLASMIDGEHCDIQQFGRFHAAIIEMRLDEPEAIESSRLYTFKAK